MTLPIRLFAHHFNHAVLEGGGQRNGSLELSLIRMVIRIHVVPGDVVTIRQQGPTEWEEVPSPIHQPLGCNAMLNVPEVQGGDSARNAKKVLECASIRGSDEDGARKQAVS